METYGSLYGGKPNFDPFFFFRNGIPSKLAGVPAWPPTTCINGGFLVEFLAEA